MLVDTSKTAFENMLALLNLTNGTEYTADDVVFGNPTAYSDPEHPEANTKVVLTGVGDYSGTMDLFYKRLDLDREIQYRNYVGGDFVDVPLFMTYLATRNDVIGDQVRLEIDYIPNGPVELITRILPVANSLIYQGEREIAFMTPAP